MIRWDAPPLDVSGHPHSCESSFLVHPVSCVPCPACCAHRQRKRRLPKPTRRLPTPTKGPPTPQERAADYALPLKRRESCGLNEQRKTTRRHCATSGFGAQKIIDELRNGGHTERVARRRFILCFGIVVSWRLCSIEFWAAGLW